jgi:hypothetical protein
MKTIAAIVLLSCCALGPEAFGQDKQALSAAEAACGLRNIRYAVSADKSQHPTPTPDSGKALIYVLQKDDATTRGRR